MFDNIVSFSMHDKNDMDKKEFEKQKIENK